MEAEILAPLIEIRAAKLTTELRRHWVKGNKVKLIVPDGTTRIRYEAFNKCTALVEVQFPASLAIIDPNAFNKCSALTRIHFPDDSALTLIEWDAFSGCTALTEVRFPPTLTTIGGGAFFKCTALTEVHFPAALTKIGVDAFYSCPALTEVHCRSTQLGIVAPTTANAFWNINPPNPGLVAVCPAIITDMGGNQYILDLTVSLITNNFNPVEQLMARYGAEIDAGQDPEVDNDNVVSRIVSGDIDISRHLDAIRDGEVDFQKLVLTFVYRN